MVKREYASRSLRGLSKCCLNCEGDNRKRSKIKNRSTKRGKEEAEYLRENRAYLQTHREAKIMCPVYPDKEVTEVHHKKGRIGKLLLDKKFWLAVSREGHRYIHNNIDESMNKGWLLSRLKK